jgi:hypothetical protein
VVPRRPTAYRPRMNPLAPPSTKPTPTAPTQGARTGSLWPGSSNAFRNELIEAAWFFDWVVGAPEPAKTALGTAAVKLASGAIATSMLHDPVTYWSKALGFDRPVDRQVIAEVVNFYRATGTPSAAIQIAPALLPADWEDICIEFGLTADSTWIKLAGPVNAPRGVPSGLRVGPVGRTDLEEWAGVVFRGFGMPTENLPSLAAASARRGTVEAFGVWVGSDLVAGASLAGADRAHRDPRRVGTPPGHPPGGRRDRQARTRKSQPLPRQPAPRRTDPAVRARQLGLDQSRQPGRATMSPLAGRPGGSLLGDASARARYCRRDGDEVAWI